ncbi:MAG: hypothetical protein ACRDZ8_20605 [Acidimicrobiales bacterium]
MPARPVGPTAEGKKNLALFSILSWSRTTPYASAVIQRQLRELGHTRTAVGMTESTFDAQARG